MKSDISRRYFISSELYNEYKDYKFDSAFIYAQKLLQIGKQTNNLKKQYESIINLRSIQLSGGMFKETFDCLGLINVRLANDSLRLKYFGLKSRALLDLSAYNRSAFFSPTQRALSTSILDSAKNASYLQMPLMK